MADPSSSSSRTRTVQLTALLYVLLGVSTIIAYPSSIVYVQTHNALPLLPWGACCAMSGPVSDFVGLDAVVALAYVEVLVLSPLSILAGFLIWRGQRVGGILGVPVSFANIGIILIGFAAPYGVIFVVQLWLLSRIWTKLE